MASLRRRRSHSEELQVFMLRSIAQSALLLLTVLVFALQPGVAQKKGGEDVAVVVNPSTPVTEMSLAEVRKVFLGDRQYWNSSMPVVLLVRAPVAREREVVLRTIYQMGESQFKQYWVAKIFRSEVVSAPK